MPHTRTVKLQYVVYAQDQAAVVKELTEATGGRAVLEYEKPRYFAVKEKKE